MPKRTVSTLSKGLVCKHPRLAKDDKYDRTSADSTFRFMTSKRQRTALVAPSRIKRLKTTSSPPGTNAPSATHTDTYTDTYSLSALSSLQGCVSIVTPDGILSPRMRATRNLFSPPSRQRRVLGCVEDMDVGDLRLTEKENCTTKSAPSLGRRDLDSDSTAEASQESEHDPHSAACDTQVVEGRHEQEEDPQLRALGGIRGRLCPPVARPSCPVCKWVLIPQGTNAVEEEHFEQHHPCVGSEAHVPSVIGPRNGASPCLARRRDQEAAVEERRRSGMRRNNNENVLRNRRSKSSNAPSFCLSPSPEGRSGSRGKRGIENGKQNSTRMTAENGTQQSKTTTLTSSLYRSFAHPQEPGGGEGPLTANLIGWRLSSSKHSVQSASFEDEMSDRDYDDHHCGGGMSTLQIGRALLARFRGSSVSNDGSTDDDDEDSPVSVLRRLSMLKVAQ